MKNKAEEICKHVNSNYNIIPLVSYHVLATFIVVRQIIAELLILYTFLMRFLTKKIQFF